MNKLTTAVQIVINEKYNIINTVDVLNTVMSGLVLKPTLGNQFETNQRYSSSDTLTSNFMFGISIFMISPSSTRAIGPPTAASGET